MQHLETIADVTQHEPNPVVSIIMDGENAWEYYPRNGCYFLTALYKRLSEHPNLDLTTFQSVWSGRRCLLTVCRNWLREAGCMALFQPGSGSDKNRAWDMLVEAKAVYDRVIASDRLNTDQRENASIQLARCEGSDWFWWFGDYNPGATVSDFERLFVCS